MNLRDRMERRGREEELEREIRSHLETEEEEQRENGLSPEEARYAARRRFGNTAAAVESAREACGWCSLERFWQDLSYGWRVLRRNPGFTAIAVLTLALGVGATSAIFSAVKAVVWSPLPFSHPERLVQIQTVVRQTQRARDWVAYRDVPDWKERNHTLENMGAQGFAILYLSGSGTPEGLYGARVSWDMFPTLGVQPALGRSFLKEEDAPGRNHVVILSHELWVRHFASDPGVIGRKVNLVGLVEAGRHVVVGVMPQGFNFPMDIPNAVNLPSRQMAFWVPIGLDPATLRRDGFGFRIVARLKPGVSIERAEADLNGVAAQLGREYPQTNAGRGVHLLPVEDHILGAARPAMLVLLGAVGLVVLIACVNIANLLLARGMSRARETGIRLALGAGRVRLIRQWLTESLLVAVMGVAAGLLLANAALSLLLKIAPRDIPRLSETRIDAGVLLFTFALSLVSGLLFGILPAWHASGRGFEPALKGTTRTTASLAGRRLREALIVSEIALALVLTAGAGLLIKSFLRLRAVDVGYRPDRVMTAILLLPNHRYPDTAPKILFYRRLLESLRGTPDLVSAAAVDGIPMAGNTAILYVDVEGRTSTAVGEDRPSSQVYSVTPDYLPAMGIPLLAGRQLDPRDPDKGTHAAIVNDLAAKQFWPNENPLGRRFRFAGNEPWRQVVGVVKSTRDVAPDQPALPAVYVPAEEGKAPPQFLVAKTTGSADALAPVLRRAVAAIDKDQPVFFVTSMRDMVDTALAQRRFSMTLLAGFGALALVLAAVGVYGVISYSVAQRTSEIGIRAALGARRSALLGMVLGQGMRLAGAGIVLGVAGGLALTRLLGTLLYGVRSNDMFVFLAVSIVLAAVALIAACIPARRAMNVDPIVALRWE